MRKTAALLATLLATAFVAPIQAEDTDPTLMRVAGKAVTLSEFEYAYQKNSQQLDKQLTPSEYAQLYKLFKQKVADAEAEGLDTLPSFLNEYKSYRMELAKPYLIDPSVDDSLALESYNRSKEDLEVYHILFLYPQGATPEQKAEVEARCEATRKRLVEGGEDFETVAREVSEDTQVGSNGGNLGYLTTMVVKYALESAAYNTPVGEVSQPVEQPYGFHILKVTDRRPAVGRAHVAHILLRLPKGASPEQEAAKKAEIDKIYAQLQAGADFAELAKKYSDDKRSAAQGGELIWFGVGEVDPAFAKASFALKDAGELSQPTRTSYGWHIIQMKQRKGIEPFEKIKSQILARLQNDERKDMSKFAFFDQVKERYYYTLNPQVNSRMQQVAQAVNNRDSLFIQQIKGDTTLLYSFADQRFTVDQFAQYLQKEYKGGLRNVGYDKCLYYKVNTHLNNYADSHLEQEYPEFRNLMREYHDGLLMFEVSNQKVWERAATDTLALERCFKRYRKSFKWSNPRFKGYLVQCATPELAKEIQSKIEAAPQDSAVNALIRSYNNDSTFVVKVEKGVYKQGALPLVDELAFEQGSGKRDQQLSHPFVVGEMVAQPTVYTDVRNEVVAKEQAKLEKEWLKYLKRKYRVEIEKDVLKTVN